MTLETNSHSSFDSYARTHGLLTNKGELVINKRLYSNEMDVRKHIQLLKCLILVP
jgi:hypothetical protein